MSVSPETDRWSVCVLCEMGLKVSVVLKLLSLIIQQKV